MKFRLSSLSRLMAVGLVTCLSSQVVALDSQPKANDTQSNLGYFRAPALHQNTLVFTAEGDLWTRDLSELKAKRLTSQPEQEIDARISPDGKWVAYSANYEGASEAYVIGIDGGQPKRVSFENSRVRVQGWTNEGEVLYSTDSSAGPSSYWVLRSVSPETLKVTDIPLADAIQGVIDDKGEYIYFVRFGLQTTGDNTKVYRGGAKGELWRYKLGSNNEAEPLSAHHEASIHTPMLWQDRVYFISDKDGNDNIWSMSLTGNDLRQHTQLKDWQVRGASMDNGRIVFQQGADLSLYDIAKDTISPLDTHIVSDFRYRQEHWVNNPLSYMKNATLSPDGDKVVITARSHLAVAGTDNSRLVEIGDGKHRLRQGILSTDGKWVYAISDASGEQEIWRYAADGSDDAKQLTFNGHTLRMSLSLSPDGRYLAHDDYDGNVWLLDLKKNNNSKIITNGEGLGPYADINWSGDSRFIALTKAEIGHPRTQIVLYSVKDKRAETLTSDKYESFSPRFSADGNWLYFLSNREFNATPTSPWGDRNLGPMFDDRTQIFAIALNKKAKFPFQQPNELMGNEEQDEKGDETVSVDWKGLAKRLWQVPVPSGNYSQLTVSQNKLYLLDMPHGAAAPSLMVVDIDNRSPELDVFADDVTHYALSNSGDKLFVQKGTNGSTQLFVVDAGDKMPADVSQSQVQTAQWQLSLLPEHEWQQMFEDAWLMHRDSFYDKKMRGLDWTATKAKYQPLVSRLTDRHELNDVFKQMMGELDSLHSQVRGGDLPKDADRAQAASLGARLTQTKQGITIADIYQNDPELPAMASPLGRIDVDAQEGDVIVEVNGKALQTLPQLTKMLRNKAGEQVLLTLKRKNKLHKVIVQPVDLRTNAKLRYLDWVNTNNQKVAKASDGDIGYLHLYAMGSGDIANFAREFYANYNKQGLIIDVRRNRGGNIDSWIIEKLLRKAWAFWQPTHGTPTTNMQQTFRGHLVVLTDQLTYSDGETFSAGVKSLGLAPLIGKQTSGAGVWLSGRNGLTDKGMARVAEYPQYDIKGNWIVEGRGVSPDIEVDNLPYASFNGQDAQLERAITYLKNKVEHQPVAPLKAKPLPTKGMAQDAHYHK